MNVNFRIPHGFEFKFETSMIFYISQLLVIIIRNYHPSLTLNT